MFVVLPRLKMNIFEVFLVKKVSSSFHLRLGERERERGSSDVLSPEATRRSLVDRVVPTGFARVCSIIAQTHARAHSLYWVIQGVLNSFFLFCLEKGAYLT